MVGSETPEVGNGKKMGDSRTRKITSDHGGFLEAGRLFGGGVFIKKYGRRKRGEARRVANRVLSTTWAGENAARGVSGGVLNGNGADGNWAWQVRGRVLDIA